MRSFVLLFALCVTLYLSFVTVQVAASTKCTLCTSLVGAIKDKVKDYDGKIDEVFKKKVCSKFGPFESICDDYVDKYGKIVIDALADKVDPAAVCAKLGFCNDDKWLRSLASTKEAIDMYVKVVNMNAREAAESMSSENAFTFKIKCEACEFAVEILQEQLEVAKPKAVAILEKQCQRLPGSIRGFCLNIVDNYAGELIDFLAHYPASEACAKIGFCPAKKSVQMADVEVAAVAAKAGDGQCAMCQFAIDQVEKYIGANRTEEAIKAALHKVCSQLPGSYKAQCDQLVDTYAVVLIDMVIQEFPPEKACALLGMCPAKAPAVVATADTAAASDSNDTPCAMCELIVYAAEKFVSENTTEEAVKKALHKACSHMPGSYATMCDAFVDQYLDQLIQLIKAKYPPKVICQKIGICKSAAVAVLAEAAAEPSNDNCFLCQMVITELYAKLNDTDTEKQVAQKLEKICSLLPGQFASTCNAYVAQYLPFIIQYVEQNYPPKKICQLLGQCGPSQKAAAPLREASNSYCAMCLNIVSMVELQLQDGATREQILHMLEAACNQLPSQWAHACDVAVEYFGNKIIDLILAKAPPSVVCHTIGLCPKASLCGANNQMSTLKTLARIN